VGFYGSFIPLHGIDRILLAAGELKDRKNITINIYGDGVLYKEISAMHIKSGLQNIRLKAYIRYEDLNRVINDMDICLGVFGESLKTELVVPNKIYHYAACRKPVITRDTKGVREIFTPDHDIVLSSIYPKSIAEKIILLAENPGLRLRIGQNAYSLMKNEYNEMKITRNLIDVLSKKFVTH